MQPWEDTFGSLAEDEITVQDFQRLGAAMCKSMGEKAAVECMARIVLKGHLTVVRD